jgi:O-antigen ligase
MKQLPSSLSVMLIILSALALFTPVFSAYVIGMVMLVAMLLVWLKVKRIGSTPLSSEIIRFQSLLAKIAWRQYVLWIVLVISALGAAIVTKNPDYREMRRCLGNFGVKYILLWFVFVGYWWRLAKYPTLFRRFTVTYAGASCFHLLYCLTQRLIGIDWSHGFFAVLPQGRFSYGVYRISGFMGHPLTLGYCQAVAIVCCLGFYRVAVDKSEKTAWLISSICAALVVALSGSRGPQVAAVVGVIASLPIAFWRRYFLWTATAVIVFAVTAYQAGLLNRYFEIGLQGAGGDMRLTHWKVFWQIFNDHPIFGLGPASPREAISAYYHALGADDNIRLAHNAFLQFAAEFGVLGFMAAVNWFGGWVHFVRQLRKLKMAARGLVTVIFAGAMTQNNLQDSQFLYAMTMWGILIAAREVSLDDGGSRNRKNENLLARQSGEDS